MSWYVLRTKTHHEPLAQHHLDRQGYQSYCPQFIRRICRYGQRLQRVDALFPGYLFLNLRVGIQALGPVKSTRGVLSIVRFGADYAVVPDRIMEQIHRRADRRTGLHLIEDQRPRPQSQIRVTEGPMQGIDGVFLRDCGEARVLVLLTILGHERSVQLPEYAIEMRT